VINLSTFTNAEQLPSGILPISIGQKRLFSTRLSFECLFVSVFLAKGHFMKRISALRINEHQQFGTMTLLLNDICLNDIFLFLK
jgi:hypothetical protein